MKDTRKLSTCIYDTWDTLHMWRSTATGNQISGFAMPAISSGNCNGPKSQGV